MAREFAQDLNKGRKQARSGGRYETTEQVTNPSNKLKNTVPTKGGPVKTVNSRTSDPGRGPTTAAQVKRPRRKSSGKSRSGSGITSKSRTIT